jgi:hypothetical protein
MCILVSIRTSVLCSHLLKYISKEWFFSLDYNSLSHIFYSMKPNIFLRMHDIVQRALEISKKKTDRKRVRDRSQGGDTFPAIAMGLNPQIHSCDFFKRR